MINGHPCDAGSIILCPPYSLNKLPPTNATVDCEYNLFKSPVALMTVTSFFVNSFGT